MSAALCGATPCPTAGETPGRVAAVERGLEPRLADGRLLRLAGLDPPSGTPRDPGLAETARARLSADLEGKDVTLRLLAGTPDRWGRIPAMVFVAADGPSGGGVLTKVLQDGLGRYVAEPDVHACRDLWVAAEAKARSAKLGLWADPYYGVLSIDDQDGFTARAGTIVEAEGRLLAVLPGPYRTTLRFAVLASGGTSSGRNSYNGHMLVATILPKTMKNFEARQMNLRSFIGQGLRFRGLLDLRFGPRIELAGPDDIEPIDASLDPAALSPSR